MERMCHCTVEGVFCYIRALNLPQMPALEPFHALMAALVNWQLAIAQALAAGRSFFVAVSAARLLRVCVDY